MTDDVEKWLTGRGEKFLKRVGLEEGHVVLDFGCRRCTYSIPAARVVGPGGTVYALDKDSQALEQCAALAAERNLANLTMVATSGGPRIPLADESADVVLLYDVIHLIGWERRDGVTVRRSTKADRRAMLWEVRRVARERALLSIYCPHLETHTDVRSEADIRREAEEAGFRFERDLRANLVHDERFTKGHVLNFRKAG
jgi:ubiquinone/menaquinone biosynthesis C-methylase UbiE